MTLATVARVLQLAAAVLAIVVARRRPSYRPIAVFLASMTAAGWVRFGLAARWDLASPGPYEGARRLAFHVSDLLFLAWPVALAALCFEVFRRRRAWPIALGALLAWEATIASTYPAITGARLIQIAHGGATIAGALLASVAVVLWFRKAAPPGAEHAAALLILAFTIATLLGPYLGAVAERWGLAVAIYAALYALLTILEGITLWRRSKASPLPSPSSSPPLALH